MTKKPTLNGSTLSTTSYGLSVLSNLLTKAETPKFGAAETEGLSFVPFSNQFKHRRDGAKYHDENIDQNRDRQKRDRDRQAEIENRQLAVFFDFSGLKINEFSKI